MVPVRKNTYAGARADVQTLIDEAKQLAFEKNPEAVAIFRQAIARSRVIFGKGHPTTVFCLGRLALHLIAIGQYEQALSTASEAFDLSKTVHGGWQDATAFCASTAAKCHLQLSQFLQANQIWTACSEYHARTHGTEDQRTLFARQRAAECLIELGQPEQALEILEQVLAGVRKLFGRQFRTINALIETGKCLQRLERYEEAESRFSEARSMCRELSLFKESRFCSIALKNCQRGRRKKARLENEQAQA